MAAMAMHRRALQMSACGAFLLLLFVVSVISEADVSAGEAGNGLVRRLEEATESTAGAGVEMLRSARRLAVRRKPPPPKKKSPPRPKKKPPPPPKKKSPPPPKKKSPPPPKKKSPPPTKKKSPPPTKKKSPPPKKKSPPPKKKSPPPPKKKSPPPMIMSPPPSMLAPPPPQVVNLKWYFDVTAAESFVTVSVGTTVNWEFLDGPHGIQDDDAERDMFQGPGGGWDIQFPPFTYSYTFTQKGVFGFHCPPHPFMQGQITVV